MENRIVTETGLIISSDKIVEGDMQCFESMTGSQLQYDTLDITVEGNIHSAAFKDRDGKQLYTRDNKRFMLDTTNTWKYGRWLKYYHGENLQGKFYVENVKRIGKTRYKITAMSAVGLLANSQHYGGVYQGVKFKNLVAEIIGGQIPYSIDRMVAEQPVYGWLPIATRRENLHQLLFAMNASIKKDENGDVFITALTKSVVNNIPDNRIFNGGSIDYPQPNKAIALSEHAYIARNTDEVITLYNAEIPADNITTPGGQVAQGGLVLFDQPAHDLEITGSTIIESGVNYAVLAPTAECTLTGKKYTHTIRQVTRPEVIANTSDENKVTVSNATLISVANSEGVADRLARFYGSAKKVKMDILQGTEKTGDCVSFNDPYDEATEGLISSLDTKISGILRSTAEIIADYDPPDIGNYYDSLFTLLGYGGGTWDVPAGNDKVRVVLVGGGHGGAMGETGGAPQYGTYSRDYQNGGKGGAGGKGGHAGKVLTFTLPITEGVSRIWLNTGRGGAGGDYGNSEGYDGEATTITYNGVTYTSDDGTVPTAGFVELFSGIVYAVPGQDGEDGGEGGGAALFQRQGNLDGEARGPYSGGSRGNPFEVEDEYTYHSGGQTYSRWASAYAGCGGGSGGRTASNYNPPTVLPNMDGTAGVADGENWRHTKGGHGGEGGQGANGAQPIDIGYTCGSGGEGGGGGGGAGAGGPTEASDGVAYQTHHIIDWGYNGDVYDPGGPGGYGGTGASGAIFIYYND